MIHIIQERNLKSTIIKAPGRILILIKKYIDRLDERNICLKKGINNIA